MRDVCSRIVGALSEWWGYIGWALFLSLFLMPFAVESVVLTLLVMLLAIAWWIIDTVDQAVPVWITVVGLVMLLLGIGLIIIVGWVVYWTRVRE